MAEPYQPLSINTGSAQQAIQSTENVTPNLNDLMKGIKEGFISADDIRKRVSDGPLEAATRKQDLADMTQVRPIQREADVAKFEVEKAKAQFDAESLPILNDTKREQLKQDYKNVLQHGVPKAVLDTFNKTVPGFIPYDNAKLFPKTGGVDTAYALEIIGKAFEKAEKLKQVAGAKPVDITNVSPEGVKTTFRQNVTDLGQPVGTAFPTGVQNPKVGDTLKEFKSTRTSHDGTKEEEVVYQFDSATGKVVGEPTVLGSKPVKLTQEQANALQFSDRMGLNNAMVSDLTSKGFDPTAIKTTVQSYLPNRFQPEALQSYTAAKSNWITAALRKESGAAISPSEYTTANKEYFPRDGDSPSVVKQKEALRFLVEEDIRLSTPGAGFWNPGNRDKSPGAAQRAEARAAASGATSLTTPAAPGAAVVSPTETAARAAAPIIDFTDPAKGDAAVLALPPNVPHFKQAGSEDLYENPNYVRTP